MLIYIEETLDEESKKFKLLAHKFDSHFKLSMMFHGEKLLPGQYIISVVPHWHESAYREPCYQQIRTGIYAPIDLMLEKYERSSGYHALSQVFAQISDKKIIKNLQLMTELPSEYKNRCFKDIDADPVHGLYGYLLFKNISNYNME